MSIYACKGTFMGLGIESVSLSTSLASQNCTICTLPLAVHHRDASPIALSNGYHRAIRITLCGHVHGKDCLSAWLDTGHSCPTCNRTLFQANSDRITQEDVNIVLKKLAPRFGRAAVMNAIVKYFEKQEQEHSECHFIHEQEVANQDTPEEQDEEFVDSNVEIGFSDDEGEIDYNDEDEGGDDGENDD
ncbi:hypothetical protein GQ44DRAFT_424008 [Phaeosphaeriaceae sp. PMI808]|nr:hypothetical protein GQ44DRAFT_424008 [Phaeosphaeriaceae sp. PMI808]